MFGTPVYVPTFMSPYLPNDAASGEGGIICGSFTSWAYNLGTVQNSAKRKIVVIFLPDKMGVSIG